MLDVPVYTTTSFIRKFLCLRYLFLVIYSFKNHNSPLWVIRPLLYIYCSQIQCVTKVPYRTLSRDKILDEQDQSTFT